MNFENELMKQCQHFSCQGTKCEYKTKYTKNSPHLDQQQNWPLSQLLSSQFQKMQVQNVTT